MRQSGCHLSEMPKTFVDAITITRHLGIRHLWIDSLCICQDDPEDWARESSCMCDVYNNAHVVIAANRSGDCEGGCFHVRESRPQAVVDLKVGDCLSKGVLLCATLLSLGDQQIVKQPDSMEKAMFHGEPLIQRGW